MQVLLHLLQSLSFESFEESEPGLDLVISALHPLVNQIQAKHEVEHASQNLTGHRRKPLIGAVQKCAPPDS